MSYLFSLESVWKPGRNLQRNLLEEPKARKTPTPTFAVRTRAARRAERNHALARVCLGLLLVVLGGVFISGRCSFGAFRTRRRPQQRLSFSGTSVDSVQCFSGNSAFFASSSLTGGERMKAGRPHVPRAPFIVTDEMI